MITAGYLGLPLVIKSSPYEANFSNLLHDSVIIANYVAFSIDEYVNKSIRIVNSRHHSDGLYLDIIRRFNLTFNPSVNDNHHPLGLETDVWDAILADQLQL